MQISFYLLLLWVSFPESASFYGQIHMSLNMQPFTTKQKAIRTATQLAKALIPTVLAQGDYSYARDFQPISTPPELGQLGPQGYTSLGNLNMCRVLNGMWQVSGAHGYMPERDRVVIKMTEAAGNTHLSNFYA
jgi:hypothetical protein